MKNWERAAAQMRLWYDEGRDIPYYVRNHFHPFISKMFDQKYRFDDREFDKTHDILYQQLTGPYGWAILQALLIKYRERLNIKWKEKNEQRKKANHPNII